VFAAIFFVAVGMTIEPRLVLKHWLPIVVLTAVVLVGKISGVTVGSFLAGNGLRRSVRAGMSMAQIGEFSFIIAALGIGSKAVGEFLLPVAVGVSCLTAVTTPWLIRGSDRAAALVDARLPRRLQTFVSFYGSWIEEIRAAPPRRTRGSRLRRTVALLLIDEILLAAVVIATSTSYHRLSKIIVVGACLAAGLFVFGMVRCAHSLARQLAGEVVPAKGDGQLDLGKAPRRALVLTLELGIMLVVGLPLIAAIGPFLPSGLLLFAIVILIIAAAIWRSIANLQGHVRAGSELIVETLARQSREPKSSMELEQVRNLLPGIPGLSPVRLAADSAAVGKTLGELNVRALTGATVLAINRGEAGTVLPSAGEVLRAGDVLALAGPAEAVEAARQLLASGAESRQSP
jgi:CPA2 family monovalent cation:H+ antiporter-2